MEGLGVILHLPGRKGFDIFDNRVSSSSYPSLISHSYFSSYRGPRFDKYMYSREEDKNKYFCYP